MPPRSSGAQVLGAQLQEQVESLRSTSSAAASRAERSLRAELAEARAEAALLRHELLQAEEAHAAAAAVADGVDSHGGKWIWRHERAADQLPRVADGVVDETAVDRTPRGAGDISRSRETPGLQRRRAQNPRVANGAAQRERRTRRVLAGERRVRRAARVAAAAARRRVRRLMRSDRRAVCGRTGAAHRRSCLGGGARADGRRGGRGFSLRRRARLRQLLHPRRRIVSIDRPIRIPTANPSPRRPVREPSSKTEAPSRRAAASRRGAGGADGPQT